MFEEIIYYAIGFPLSQEIGTGALRDVRFNRRLLTDRPLILVPIGAILARTTINLIGLPVPDASAAASAAIVPVMTALLGLAIGVTLRISRISAYRRQVTMVLSIKYLMVPLVIIPLAHVLGLGEVMSGVPFDMVVVVSFMPTAFIARVPPASTGSIWIRPTPRGLQRLSRYSWCSRVCISWRCGWRGRHGITSRLSAVTVLFGSSRAYPLSQLSVRYVDSPPGSSRGWRHRPHRSALHRPVRQRPHRGFRTRSEDWARTRQHA